MTISIPPTFPVGSVQHGAERRSNERSAINIQAILRFQDRLHTLQGNICDLSIGGCGFICHQAVTAQSKCTLQFNLPALSHFPSHAVNTPVIAINSMQVIGQAHLFRVNLRFINLPHNIHSHIEALIRQSLSHHSS
jgi:c-di-GMP-binding flagellar brake protein YcgR